MLRTKNDNFTRLETARRAPSRRNIKWLLKPGFHMIVWIVQIARIVPVVSKNVQTIGTIIWKRYPDDSKRPGLLQNLHDRPDRSDRTQFYPSDRGRLSRPVVCDRLGSVSIWSSRFSEHLVFETTGTIRTIGTIIWKPGLTRLEMCYVFLF